MSPEAELVPALVPGRFDGRTVIVTGAGSGIGKATALRLAREGATVVATDVVEGRLTELTEENPDLTFVTVAGDISAQEVEELASVTPTATRACSARPVVSGLETQLVADFG